MGRKRIYTPKKLRAAVDAYLGSIRRRVQASEMVPSGEVDRYGRAIQVQRGITAADGQPLMRWEYGEPPSIGGLCERLGVHRNTWRGYAADPAYEDAASALDDAIHAYLERELLERDKPQGIIFALQNRGYTAAVAVDVRAVDMALKTDDELMALVQQAAEEKSNEDGQED